MIEDTLRPLKRTYNIEQENWMIGLPCVVLIIAEYEVLVTQKTSYATLKEPAMNNILANN